MPFRRSRSVVRAWRRPYGVADSYQMGGKTRFDEPIVGGIIGPVTDSSVDELMSAKQVVTGAGLRPGPGAGVVVVFETPAAAFPLARRIAAHVALLRTLATRLLAVPDGY